MENETASKKDLATPGPWGLRGYQIRADGGTGRHVATYQICEADGRLLAAAPDLLALLRNVLEWDLGTDTTTQPELRRKIEALGLDLVAVK